MTILKVHFTEIESQFKKAQNSLKLQHFSYRDRIIPVAEYSMSR